MPHLESGGKYVFVNAKIYDNALDLHSVNNKTVMGFHTHYGTNQQWWLEGTSTPNQFRVRSVRTGSYLCTEGPAVHGSSVIAAADQQIWEFRPEPSNIMQYRIVIPGVDVNIDMGSDGSTIKLLNKWPDFNQQWFVLRVQ